MGNIFKTISDSLAEVSKGQNKIEGVDKKDILDLIDDNILLLKTIIETYDDNRDVFKYIQTTLLPANGANKDNISLLSMYNEYVTTLSPLLRHRESDLIFKSLRDAITLVLNDHNKLRDNFTTLFNQGTDDAEIKLDQLKLSHAAIFGFIDLTLLMCDWFSFFYTSLVGNPNTKLRIPAYREAVIKDANQSVARFVTDVLNRGANRDILYVLSTIKNKGDVTLYTNTASLESYASASDYPNALGWLGAFAGFLFSGVMKLNPVLYIRMFFANRAHDLYKRNLANRDWMITKTAILRMDMNGTDPNAKEYQHMLSVLSKYSDLIAELDKKIAEYETIS